MKIDCQLEYQTILANEARPVHAVVLLQAAKRAGGRDLPLAFCAVLDRSGSMEGPPFEQAKKACETLVRHLRPQDQFSLVLFEDEARVVFPLQPVTDKQDLVSRIRSLRTRNSTNLTAGWMLGRDELRKAPKDVSRHLLLLTDGLLNVGITRFEQVEQVVAQGREKDLVRTTCLGFGNDYLEDLLRQLAKISGGDFYDADAPEKLPVIFREVLQGLQAISAQNVRLRLRPLDFCETLGQLGAYPVTLLSDQRFEFALGDLVSEEDRALVLVTEVLPLPLVDGRPVASLEGEKLFELELLWDELGELEIKSCQYEQVIRISATQDPAEIKLNEDTVSWIAVQRAGKALDEATKEVDAHRVEEAKLKLRTALKELRRYKLDAKTADGIRILKDFLHRIDQEGGLSPRARKMSSYASGYYSRPSSRRAWSGPADATPLFSDLPSVEKQIQENDPKPKPPPTTK